MAAITDLAAASTVNASDQLVVNQGNSPTGDRRVTADKFAILAAANQFSQILVAPRIRSASLGTILDDGVVSFTPSGSNGILIILGNNLATASGIIMYRCGGGSQCALLAATAGTLLNCLTDTILTGTTGPDGKVNISANGGDGKIYIENRRGASTTTFSYLEIG